MIPPQRQPAVERITAARRASVILFIIVPLLMRWPQRRLWIQIISDFPLGNSLYSLCAVFNSAWVLPLSKVQQWMTIDHVSTLGQHRPGATNRGFPVVPHTRPRRRGGR